MDSQGAKDAVRSLFEPNSVAVVGASEDPTKFGYLLMKNLIELGYSGKIYPVNKSRDTVLGYKCYPTVKSIPNDFETVIIIVPAQHIPQIMKECAEKKVKGAVVCTSGFREAGEKGAELEREMLQNAKIGGIRIAGPNTTGLLNVYNGFTSAFVKISKPRRGSVSIISQTGMFGSVLLEHILSTQAYGLSKVAGLGNKADLDDSDILEYLEDDANTKVIAIYAEGIKNGRRFLEISKRVLKKKPVIILKSARSGSGGKAALTHTGSLMVRDEIFDAVCKTTGLIRVEDIEELLDTIKAFAFLPPSKGDRIGVIAYTGAGCVMSADAIEKYGLKLAKLSEQTMQKLKRFAPDFGILSNPLDAELVRQGIGSAEGSLVLALESYLEDPNVDMVSLVLVGLTKESNIWDVDTKKVFSEIKRKFPAKPLVVTNLASKEVIDEYREILEELGIPTYPSLLRNIRALSALSKYCRRFPTETKY
ncbi:MAG: CoA-binding protein [Candidatus Bathyarchaeota archaeon]|nr:CoA-binding protein [Candidatus Bathyarchaeota archaeon]